MSEKTSYSHYVTDQSFLSDYNAYQAKYAKDIRESDKVLLEIVRDAIGANRTRPLRLLDIGCSTGNLLLHLKRLFPDLELTGADLAESSLEECRRNPALEGIRFEKLDMLKLPRKDHFDIVVANAVAVYFYWDEYEKALRSVGASLRRGGTYIAFEWLHPFEHQDIVITETTMGHPEGLRICFRPMKRVAELLGNAGFTDIQFRPFDIPIELPMRGHDQEVFSYTVRAADGRNICFRGALSQPWCHLIARKS
jgi:SAM-dependent methyltransferase